MEGPNFKDDVALGRIFKGQALPPSGALQGSFRSQPGALEARTPPSFSDLVALDRIMTGYGAPPPLPAAASGIEAPPCFGNKEDDMAFSRIMGQSASAPLPLQAIEQPPPQFGPSDKDVVVLSRLLDGAANDDEDDVRLNNLLGSDQGWPNAGGGGCKDIIGVQHPAGDLLTTGVSPADAVLEKIRALKADREERIRDAVALESMIQAGEGSNRREGGRAAAISAIVAGAPKQIPHTCRVRGIQVHTEDVQPGSLAYFAAVADASSAAYLCDRARRCNDTFLVNSTQADKRAGRTALHFAAWDGHVEIVRLLLQADADVLSKDVDGRTPLHMASFRGHEAIVRVMLGSCLKRLRASGLRHFRDLRAHFFEETGDAGAAEQLAAVDALVEYLRSLEDLRFNLVHSRDIHHHTCAHYAVRDSFGGCLGVLRILLTCFIEYNNHPYQANSLMSDDKFQPQSGVSFVELLAAHLPKHQEQAIQDEHLKLSDGIGLDMVSSQDRQGLTLLHYASAEGNYRSLPLLVALRADPEARASLPQPGAVQDRDVASLVGVHPLDLAADMTTRTMLFGVMAHGGQRLEKQAECLFREVEHNQVPVNHQCGLMARTPLHLMLFSGIETMSEEPPTNLKALLELHPDCDPFRPDASGWTPLHYACAFGRSEELRELLEHGKRLHPQIFEGGGLRGGIAGQWRQRQRNNPAADAHRHRKLGTATKPLKATAKGTAASADKATLGRKEAPGGKRSATAVGAPPAGGLEALMGRTPTHLAAQGAEEDKRAGGSSHVDCLVLLHHYGLLELEAEDDRGHSPLLSASQTGAAVAIRWLLKMDADCTKVNKLKETALHLAIAKGHREVVRMLTEYDCDTSVLKQNRDWKGRRPLDMQRTRWAQKPTTVMLEDYSTVWEAARDGDLDQLRLALRGAQGGANSRHVDALSPAGWTAAMYAASEGHVAVLRFLLAARCDCESAGAAGAHAGGNGGAEGGNSSSFVASEFQRPKVRPTRGRGPLHLAAAAGHVKACDVLMRVGSALLEGQSGDGRTPLAHACIGGHLSVVQLLVSGGADVATDVDAGTQPSRTLFHLLAAGNTDEHAKCIQWLAMQLEPYLALELLERRALYNGQLSQPGDSAHPNSRTSQAITRARKNAQQRSLNPAGLQEDHLPDEAAAQAGAPTLPP